MASPGAGRLINNDDSMPEKKLLTADLLDDINRVGNLSVLQWFAENDIAIGQRGNVFELLAALQKKLMNSFIRIC